MLPPKFCPPIFVWCISDLVADVSTLPTKSSARVWWLGIQPCCLPSSWALGLKEAKVYLFLVIWHLESNIGCLLHDVQVHPSEIKVMCPWESEGHICPGLPDWLPGSLSKKVWWWHCQGNWGPKGPEAYSGTDCSEHTCSNITALKEPCRDREEQKNIKHLGNITFFSLKKNFFLL